MKALLLLGATLLLNANQNACQEEQPKPYWVHTQGTVRHVGYDKQGSHVIIETEEHSIYTVNLLDSAPPVWVGLHGRFSYESSSKEQGLWKNFHVDRRLPDGMEKP